MLAWVATVSKATVGELSDHLKDLLASPFRPDKMLCHNLPTGPTSFIGKSIRHVWSDNECNQVYFGTVTAMEDFSMQFEGDDSAVFSTRDLEYIYISDAVWGYSRCCQWRPDSGWRWIAHCPSSALFSAIIGYVQLACSLNASV